MTPSPVVEIETMDCYAALKLVAGGAKVRRQCWPEGQSIFMHALVLHLRKEGGSLHTLMVSDADLQGTDWVVVRES